MPFEHWTKLLYGIERGECILFLGPDLPAESPGREPRGPVQRLARRLAEGLGLANGDTAGSRAWHLAQLSQRFLAQEDEVGLEMEVARWHEELSGERSPLHEDLAALPFRLVVTSSHDPFMENALRAAGKTPAIERYHYRGTSSELLPVPTAEAPVLFHLYGHVAEPRSVVLTETQLLDFLAAIIAKDPPLPSDLRAALTESRLFLFLGFGLRQWYLRILLHVLKVLRRGSRSFAVETLDDGAGSVDDDAILFYRENFKLNVHHEDVGEFVRELRRRYTPPDTEPEAAHPTPPALRPVADRPKVFICHASEDARRAREVHDELKRVGLDPWLDQESLRGGDRWDPLIESTIQGVDYFVVLNSHALAAKSRRASYVNKEIKVALRAEDWRLGKFIVPVKIDDAPLLGELGDLHAVDLGKPDGMRDLVRAIKRQAGAH